MSRPGRILLVDDEVNVTTALARVLRRGRWEVETATSGGAGLEKLRQRQPFSVVVSDFRMPEMDGSEFLERARAEQPDATRVLLTGYADIQAAMHAINRGAVYKFLVKPWREEELLEALGLALRQYELLEENRRLQREVTEKNAQLEALNAGLEARVVERTQEVQALNRDLQSSLMGTIQVMGALAEQRSGGIGGYARRVAGLAGILARRLGLSAGDIFRVQAAGFLHHIGGLASGKESARLIRLVPNMKDVAALIEEAGAASSTMGAKALRVAVEFERALNSAQARRAPDPLGVLQQLESRERGDIDPQAVACLREHLESTNQLRADRYELQVGFFHLRKGMVLARDIHSRGGQLLLTKGTELTRDHLQTLRARGEELVLADEIYVFRASVDAA